MSRPITGKIEIEGTFTTLTPLSVGGAASGDDVDLELARNGAGQWYIPGTSLLGAMRHWAMDFFGDDYEEALRKMMGWQDTERGKDKPEGWASHLIVDDSPLDNDGPQEIRYGVRLDRQTGTAAEGALYTRAMIPLGRTFPLRMELELPPPEKEKEGEKGKDWSPEFQGLLARMLLEWQGNGLRLGAAKTRGLGKVELSSCTIRVYAFKDKAEALFDWLKDNKNKRREITPENLAKEHEITPRPKYAWVDVEIPWKPKSRIMVKASREGIKADMMPMVSELDSEHLAPVIPWSSIKGALRSHAARILRTLEGSRRGFKPDDPDPEYDLAENEDHVSLVHDLFGSANWAGRVFGEDVYQRENSFSYDEWNSEKESLFGNQIGDPNERPTRGLMKRPHVAIDRFSGGASDSALFSTAAPVKSVDWDPIRFSIRLPASPSENQIIDFRAQLVLVYLLVRDLKDGLIPLGFGTNRGFGTIEIEGEPSECFTFPDGNYSGGVSWVL